MQRERERESYFQLSVKSRRLILWNVRGNRRAMIHGGVQEKRSKIALIHIHKLERSLLLTPRMINRRQGAKCVLKKKEKQKNKKTSPCCSAPEKFSL